MQRLCHSLRRHQLRAVNTLHYSTYAAPDVPAASGPRNTSEDARLPLSISFSLFLASKSIKETTTSSDISSARESRRSFAGATGGEPRGALGSICGGTKRAIGRVLLSSEKSWKQTMSYIERTTYSRETYLKVEAWLVVLPLELAALVIYESRRSGYQCISSPSSLG